MDIEVIIKKALVVAAVGLLLVSIYGGTLRLVSFVLGADEQRSSFWALFATLVVAVVAPWLWQRDSGGARSALLPRSLRLPARAHELHARFEQRSRPQPAEHAPGRARRRDARHRSHRALPARSARRDGPVRGGRVGRVSPAASCRRSSRARRLARGWSTARPWSSTIPVPARRLSGDEAVALARGGPVQLRAVRLDRLDDRPHRGRAPRARRAAQQRGHDAARRGRRPGGDGDRERAPLQSAAEQGERDRAAAPVQRQRRRVADRRPGRRRSRRSRAAVEPPRGSARRRRSRPGASAGGSARCSAGRSSTRSSPRAASRRRARRSTACRSRPAQAARSASCS